MARGKKGKAYKTKTKTGHEYRVRGPRGKIRGEYESATKAEKKEQKLERKYKKGGKKKMKTGGKKKYRGGGKKKKY